MTENCVHHLQHYTFIYQINKNSIITHHSYSIYTKNAKMRSYTTLLYTKTIISQSLLILWTQLLVQSCKQAYSTIFTTGQRLLYTKQATFIREHYKQSKTRKSDKCRGSINCKDPGRHPDMYFRRPNNIHQHCKAFDYDLKEQDQEILKNAQKYRK